MDFENPTTLWRVGLPVVAGVMAIGLIAWLDFIKDQVATPNTNGRDRTNRAILDRRTSLPKPADPC